MEVVAAVCLVIWVVPSSCQWQKTGKTLENYSLMGPRGAQPQSMLGGVAQPDVLQAN